MKVLYAREQTTEDGIEAVFLAGPSPRGNGEPDWRKDACHHLEQIGFSGTVYCPLPRDGRYHDNYDYDDQITWELAHLEKAAVIVLDTQGPDFASRFYDQCRIRALQPKAKRRAGLSRVGAQDALSALYRPAGRRAGLPHAGRDACGRHGHAESMTVDHTAKPPWT